MIDRILILEDVRQAREWLISLVAQIFPKADIIDYALLRPALQTIAETRYDLALIDLSLPDGEGTTLLRQLSKTQPDCALVVTTAMASDKAIVDALAAGAQGYLLKSDPENVFESQLRNLLAGIPALSPQVARRIMQHFRLTGPALEPDDALTPRETQVLTMIARGMRVAEVAEELSLAESTILTYIKAIYRKLEISTRAEAALHASRLGLLEG